ncbi:MAG: hypothetical protein K1X72_15305 [Pyrinomonadaceae bacterium]|nr:hypothetical protein [Pyrinomonadaceae bacterium]
MNVNFGSHIVSPAASTQHFIPFTGGSREVSIVIKAIELIRQRACSNDLCNIYFKVLDNKRTFEEIYIDENVWINYRTQPFRGNEPPWQGQTALDGKIVSGGKEYDIAIHSSSFFLRKSLPEPKQVEEIAAIIVHEMAHVAGAPNLGPQAEQALIHCGFLAQYDSTISG